MAKSSEVSKTLKELDDKINACIQDISDLFGGVENLNKDFIVINTDHSSKDFQEMLQKLELLISGHHEISEYILPHLDEIRKQNNIKFCGRNLQLINASESNSSSEKTQVQVLWNNICCLVEKYLYTTVFENYVPHHSLHNHFNLCQLRNYCICLQNIFSSKDIWTKYKNFRLKYMERYFCNCKANSCCFACYLKLCIQCIYEDHLLCYIGCFHPNIVTQTSILDTYSGGIFTEFSKLLKLLNKTVKSGTSLPKEIISLILGYKNVFRENFRTCYSCFIQLNLCNEMETIMQCIDSGIGTDSLWKKLFIFSVLKLIENMSLFEDQTSILFNLGKDVNFHSHDENISALFEGSKLILATDSPEESPFHESLHGNSEKGHPINKLFSWNWRLILVENAFISETQRALQMEVEEIISSTTVREKHLLKTGDWKNLINSERALNFQSLTVQTDTLLDSILNTVLILEKYVPVLTSAVGVFQPFKYSFCHTLDTYIIDLLKHLQHLNELGNNIYFLYIVCNNAIFLKNQLKYYCDIMEGPDMHVNDSCMNNICRSANKFGDEVLDTLLNLHFKYVSCGILFDAESYNFEDIRPFFEGERISYSIQMWKMYMEGLYHDATYFLPQSFAQELYAKVLSFSLDRFLIRYSKSSVTEARHPQLLQDIYTILLCTTELIHPACSRVSEVIGKKEEFNETKIASIVDKIHSNCCCLLSVLVVLTSPMSEMYKVFKDGFPQPRLSTRSKYECLSPWLPWIRRELFSNLGQSKIMSNVQVWLAVKVCTTYKVPLPHTIIQAFTEHHCTLAILLMMQASDLVEEDTSLFKQNEESKIHLAYSLSLLMLCYDNYSYILDIFLPVIEKTNGWDEFDSSSSCKILSERSWWYSGLYKALSPFLKSTFEEIESFWFEVKSLVKDLDALKLWINFRNELKEHVICVCQNDSLNSFEDDFNFSSDTISFLCIKKVLELLHDNLMFLPQPFKYALSCLDAHIQNYMPEIKPAGNSVFIQFLLSCSALYLKEQEYKDSLPTIIKDMAFVTSDALDALCKKDDTFFKNANFKKDIAELTTKMKEEFDSIRNNFETTPRPNHFEEIQDDVLSLTAKKIIEISEGINVILYLHKILCGNEAWIQSNLGIPDMLSTDIVVSPISPSPILSTGIDSPKENSTEKVSEMDLQTSNIAAQRYSSFRAPGREESFDSQKSLENTFILPPHITQLQEKSEIYTEQKFKLLVDDSIASPVFDFNPLSSFEKLGASSFTKVALEKPILPWEALLSHLPILGITEINFQILFKKRWDVHREVATSAEEMSQIEELRNLYKYEE